MPAGRHSTSTALSGQLKSQIWVGAYLSLSFGHVAWLTPWQYRLKYAPRRTRKTSIGVSGMSPPMVTADVPANEILRIPSGANVPHKEMLEIFWS